MLLGSSRIRFISTPVRHPHNNSKKLEHHRSASWSARLSGFDFCLLALLNYQPLHQRMIMPMMTSQSLIFINNISLPLFRTQRAFSSFVCRIDFVPCPFWPVRRRTVASDTCPSPSPLPWTQEMRP